MTRYYITNKRVFFKVGVFSTNTTEFKITQIESISFSQSLLGKMCNYGDIAFSGSGGIVFCMKSISQPYEVKKITDDMMNKIIYKK